MDRYLRNESRIVTNESETRIFVDVYDVERGLELVSERIRESKEIAERNKQLVFEFTDNRILRGLSKFRAAFYLNRFWNITRLAEKSLRMSQVRPCNRLSTIRLQC